MKSFNFNILLLLFVVFSCKEKEVEADDTSMINPTNLLTESIVASVDENIQIIANELNTALNSGDPLATPVISSIKNCAVISIFKPSSATDSVITYKVEFSPSGCKSTFDFVHKGIYYIDVEKEGSIGTYTFKFENYEFNNHKISNDSESVCIIDGNKITRNATIQLTTNYNVTIKRKTIDYVTTITKDKFSPSILTSTGSSIVTLNNRLYQTKISVTKPIVWRSPCPFYNSGRVVYTYEGNNYSIDYGVEYCDKFAELVYPSGKKEILTLNNNPFQN